VHVNTLFPILKTENISEYLGKKLLAKYTYSALALDTIKTMNKPLYEAVSQDKTLRRRFSIEVKPYVFHDDPQPHAYYVRIKELSSRDQHKPITPALTKSPPEEKHQETTQFLYSDNYGVYVRSLVRMTFRY
jgi:hypothetical protein